MADTEQKKTVRKKATEQNLPETNELVQSTVSLAQEDATSELARKTRKTL